MKQRSEFTLLLRSARCWYLVGFWNVFRDIVWMFFTWQSFDLELRLLLIWFIVTCTLLFFLKLIIARMWLLVQFKHLSLNLLRLRSKALVAGQVFHFLFGVGCHDHSFTWCQILWSILYLVGSTINFFVITVRYKTNDSMNSFATSTVLLALEVFRFDILEVVCTKLMGSALEEARGLIFIATLIVGWIRTYMEVILIFEQLPI